MLAYAAQGLPHEQGAAGSQIREFLREQALDGWPTRPVRPVSSAPKRRRQMRLIAVHHDARHARAAVRLVLAQPAIGSQLVDNLNASSHLRAVLTDVFLLDESLAVTAFGTVDVVNSAGDRGDVRPRL
jgi:hypothetical protein